MHTIATSLAALLILVACAPVHEPPSTTPAAPSSTVASVSPATPAEEPARDGGGTPPSAAPAGFVPPQPYHVLARAPSARTFRFFDTVQPPIVAACLDTPANGCLQPLYAELHDGRLTPRADLGPGLPGFHGINLAAEPEGHWSGISAKADSQEARLRCYRQRHYPGPRTLAGLHGTLGEDAWVVSDRAGEEPAMTTVSTVFRYTGGRWRSVFVTARPGESVSWLAPYRGGALAMVTTAGTTPVLHVVDAPPGVARPRMPKGMDAPDEIRAVDDGTIVAVSARFAFRAVAWTPGSTTPIDLSLPSLHEVHTLELRDDRRVFVGARGEIPVEAKRAQSDSKPIEITLELRGRKWRVAEQRYVAEPEEPATHASELDKAGFSPSFVSAPSGWDLVGGHAELGGELRSLLLGKTEPEEVWEIPEVERRQEAPEIDEECLKRVEGGALF